MTFKKYMKQIYLNALIAINYVIPTILVLFVLYGIIISVGYSTICAAANHTLARRQMNEL